MGRPYVALWALLAGAMTEARSTDPPPTIAPGCSPADTVRACILSDRPEMMLAVLRSAHASASPRTCISWDLFTTDTERIERLMLTLSGTVTITKFTKVSLVNALNHPQHRLLDNLVLQGCDGGCILHLFQLALRIHF